MTHSELEVKQAVFVGWIGVKEPGSGKLSMGQLKMTVGMETMPGKQEQRKRGLFPGF